LFCTAAPAMAAHSPSTWGAGTVRATHVHTHPAVALPPQTPRVSTSTTASPTSYPLRSSSCCTHVRGWSPWFPPHQHSSQGARTSSHQLQHCRLISGEEAVGPRCAQSSVLRCVMQCCASTVRRVLPTPHSLEPRFPSFLMTQLLQELHETCPSQFDLCGTCFDATCRWDPQSSLWPVPMCGLT
jgi:hypothetical protein